MEKRKQLVDEYNKLKESYSLPELNEVEQILNFYLSESTLYVKYITGKLMERLADIINYIGGIIHPQIPIQGYESKFLTKKQKNELFELFEISLSKFYRLRTTLYMNEKETAKLFKEIYKFYKEKLMSEMKKVDEFMCEKWAEKSSDSEFPNSYFG
jgi:hypothetical protein